MAAKVTVILGLWFDSISHLKVPKNVFIFCRRVGVRLLTSFRTKLWLSTDYLPNYVKKTALSRALVFHIGEFYQRGIILLCCG